MTRTQKEQDVLDHFKLDNLEQAAHFTIPITHEIKLIVNLSKDTLASQREDADAVVTARNIKQPQQWHKASPEVVEMANQLAASNDELPSYMRTKAQDGSNVRLEFLDHALNMMQQDSIAREQAARMEATIAMICREATLVFSEEDEDGNLVEKQRIERGLFNTRVVKGGTHVVNLNQTVWKLLQEAAENEQPIPEDYFNNGPINRRRKMHGLPPMPRKWAHLPAEQMIMFIEVMREHFMLFNNALALLWQNYISQLVEVAFALGGEEDPVDEDGFPPQPVDNDVAE